MKSSLSHVNEVFVNCNKNNLINLALENTQKSAQPNFYSDEDIEKENKDKIYEDLDDKVFLDKEDGDIALTKK